MEEKQEVVAFDAETDVPATPLTAASEASEPAA